MRARPMEQRSSPAIVTFPFDNPLPTPYTAPHAWQTAAPLPS
jgi:hypothetical protein